MNIVNGLIFRDENDDIWLGKYENGTVRVFNPLSDFEGIYDDLELTKIAFVQVDEKGDQLWIRDVCKFEVGKGDGMMDESLEPVVVTEMLEELDFPSTESDDMFGSFLTASGKAN